MNKTWASGAIELLDHAKSHFDKGSAFDNRIAFISIDNAVEVIIRSYLNLPIKFYGQTKPSRKEIEDNNNSFTGYVELVFKYAGDKLIGIEPGDIEFYHRLRNKLYHDGTGLAVDNMHLYAYDTIAKLLLKRLLNVELQFGQEVVFIENLILNWNGIEELLIKILGEGFNKFESDKGNKISSAGIIQIKTVEDINVLQALRNFILHSNSYQESDVEKALSLSKKVLVDLKDLIDKNPKLIEKHNYYYEPVISHVEGILRIKDIINEWRGKDSPFYYAKVWILELKNKINVLEDGDGVNEGDYNSTFYNVGVIQLHFSNNELLKKLENKQVKVEGGFWGGHTAHHYTDVLMTVKSISEII